MYSRNIILNLSGTSPLSYKIKLSMSQQNKKSVYQYDINNNLIKEWVSTGSIERELGFNRACIRKCCNGDIKKSYGYFWSWKLL